MNWWKNKKIITLIFVLRLFLDICISFLINIVSQEEFNILDIHNIVALVILFVLIILYITCHLLLRDRAPKTQNKRLQKAFQENGGYETVAKEMNKCIVNRDYKSIKVLKKMVDYIEK